MDIDFFAYEIEFKEVTERFNTSIEALKHIKGDMVRTGHGNIHYYSELYNAIYLSNDVQKSMSGFETRFYATKFDSIVY